MKFDPDAIGRELRRLTGMNGNPNGSFSRIAALVYGDLSGSTSAKRISKTSLAIAEKVAAIEKQR